MEFYADTTMYKERVFEDTYPEDYVKRYRLEIYKMPKKWEEIERIHDGEESNKKNLVCTIDGNLILSAQAYIDGENIVGMCDEYDEILEHIAAAVVSTDVLPPNTFAIEGITFGPACDSEKTLIEVLHMLPRFIYKAYNVTPVIAVFPLPLPYEKTTSQIIKEKFATKIYGDRMKEFFEKRASGTQDNDENENKDDCNTIRLVLDEEQVNYVLGKFNKDNPYPREAKDKPLWDLFESAGFKEIGKTMVLWNGE